MKLIALIVLILLYGCAIMSSDDLYALANQCNQDNLEPVVVEGVVQMDGDFPKMGTKEGACDVEWAAFNKQEESRIKREKERESKTCPPGQIYVCSHWSCRGSNPSMTGGCVSREDLNRIFGR